MGSITQICWLKPIWNFRACLVVRAEDSCWVDVVEKLAADALPLIDGHEISDYGRRNVHVGREEASVFRKRRIDVSFVGKIACCVVVEQEVLHLSWCGRDKSINYFHTEIWSSFCFMDLNQESISVKYTSRCHQGALVMSQFHACNRALFFFNWRHVVPESN